MFASLWNTPNNAIDLEVWSKANAISHQAIIIGIQRMSSVVIAITLTHGGSGYTSAPDVAIAAPDQAGGIQATATAAITGSGSNRTLTFTITNPGLGYSYAPAIVLSGGGGSGAQAAATVNYINLPPYLLDPIPENDQETWNNVHWIMHEQMLSALGIQSTNLTGIDFGSAPPDELEIYVWQHVQDHISAINAIGAYMPEAG